MYAPPIPALLSIKKIFFWKPSYGPLPITPYTFPAVLIAINVIFFTLLGLIFVPPLVMIFSVVSVNDGSPVTVPVIFRLFTFVVPEISALILLRFDVVVVPVMVAFPPMTELFVTFK